MGGNEASRVPSVEYRAECWVLNIHKGHTNNWASEQDAKEGVGTLKTSHTGSTNSPRAPIFYRGICSTSS